MNEKISKYTENLKKELESLKEEREKILKKVESGKFVFIKDGIKNKMIASQIKDIEEKLKKIENLSLFDKMLNNLEKISKQKTAKLKTEKINSLITSFAAWNEEIKKEFLDSTNFDEEDLKTSDEEKAIIEEEVKDLKIKLRLAKRKGLNTSKLEDDIKEDEKFIEQINDYQTHTFNLVEVEKDLNILAKTKSLAAEKEKIIEKYKNIILSKKEELEKDVSEMIDNEFEEEKTETEKEETTKTKTKTDKKKETDDSKKTIGKESKEEKKKLKVKTKENLNNIGEFFKRNRKRIVAIGGTTVILITFIAAAKSCSKDNDKNNDNDLDNSLGIEQTYEKQEIIDSLVKIGYDPYAAMIMAENFDRVTIKSLQGMPYIKAVENYATEKEFIFDNLKNYEDAMITYNLTSDKAVDYVNRSAKIQVTGFFEDATINEIVAVVKAIDDKTLFMADNANLASSITTGFNGIVNDSLFGAVNKEDLDKLDALAYFAKGGSDLGLFLTEFGVLAKKILINQNDIDAKNKMYNYLAEFTLSLNGFTNTDEDISVEKPYNTNAQVSDALDWYMAYNSAIAPLYPILVDENDFAKYENLQKTMLTALYNINCEKGQSLTLGGE